MLDPMDRSSLRIQRYLDSAQRCQELALTVGSPNTRAALREAARRWRDVAEQIEENERKRTVYHKIRGTTGRDERKRSGSQAS